MARRKTLAEKAAQKYSIAGKSAEELLNDLFAAVKCGFIAVIENILKESEIDVNKIPLESERKQGLSALHVAVRCNQPAAVRCLISLGANVDVMDNFGFRPVHDAALLGHFECLEVLIESGCSTSGVQRKGLEHLTPLFYAIQQNHVPCAKVLNRRSASADNILWDVASKRGNASITDLATAEGLPEARIETWLYNSAQAGNKAYLRKIFGRIGRRLHKGEAKLATIGSAAHGKHQYLAELMCHGGDPNCRNGEKGATALHYAARYGHIECIELLCSYGANVDVVTKGNWTALHVAVHQGQPDSVATLIRLRCNVNIKGGDHEDTPLHIALKSCTESQVVRELLNGKPNLAIRNKDGLLPTEIESTEELKKLVAEYARN